MGLGEVEKDSGCESCLPNTNQRKHSLECHRRKTHFEPWALTCENEISRFQLESVFVIYGQQTVEVGYFKKKCL